MKVFVWERIDKASSNYHEEGGVVVFAETLERAVALAAEKGAIIRNDEPPSAIRTASGDEAIFIMPVRDAVR